MLNFKSNLGAYGHNLSAYERNPRANCAYEHGLRHTRVYYSLGNNMHASTPGGADTIV